MLHFPVLSLPTRRPRSIYGLSKKGFFPLMVDKHEIDLLKRIKQAFDPNNIINLGKDFDL
jgi:FAD/FMN-containing dehydrogenase